MRQRTLLVAITLAAIATAVAASDAPPDADEVRIDGGPFRSAVPLAAKQYDIAVKPFRLQRRPVTNGQFLAFVRSHPQWQRGKAPAAFADSHYLDHWVAPLQLGPTDAAMQPVTRVSWFAAEAYCEAQGARLPTWYEWELAAAANETQKDARADPAWRQAILDWYARPASGALPAVGQHPPNFYGVQDLHGLIWEWTEDAGSLMVEGDNRTPDDPDLAKFCGSGALTLEQKENYAVLMRIAMLSSLHAADTSRTMGFRCARDLPENP